MSNRAKWLSLCLVLIFVSVSVGEDWPQWRGPNRDNVSKEKGLLQQWPEGGLKLLWTYKEAGNAYSSFAVVGDHVFSMGTDGDEEFIFALDVKTGKEVWKTVFAKFFNNRWGGGPRSTPTIDGEHLYALGGQGELVCLTHKDGKKVWSINLKKDLGGKMMSGWGYSESVLIDGDHVICTPGGNGGTLAALDKKTGKVVGRSSVKDAAAYSSVRVVEVGGTKQYVTQTKNGIIGVRAKDGKLLWKHEKNAYRTAVIPTPIIHENYVYVSVGYGAGCTLLKLSKDGTKAEEVYANTSMENKHGGVTLHDGFVYGHHDRRGWACQNLKTGEMTWSERQALGRSRSGSLTFADGRFYLYSDRGMVGLLEPSGEKFKLVGKFPIPQKSKIRSARGGIWSHPVVANGRLYLRDQDLIFCYDVKAKK